MTNNNFINKNIMAAGTSMTENGAVSYRTSGSDLIDQFAHAGTARGRLINDVWNEQATIWGEDPVKALRFPFYLRMITRQTNIVGSDKTESVQRGQGARDESFKRLLWIAKYHPEEFYRNLWLLPVVGSWKDLWTLLSMDKTLDKQQFFNVIAMGINDPNHKDLVKKYLPRIRSSKVCTTDWAKTTNKLAKEFAQYVGWSMKDYREFKSTGKAHEFQRTICARDYSHIKWNTIPGKALLNLINGKFIDNHNLVESYSNWLEKQPMVKFNGYPYELGMKIHNKGWRTVISPAAKATIDKQFDNLINTATKNDGAFKENVLCALDTSGSMTCDIFGGPKGLTSYDVCISLGIYFSALNTGAFHNVVAMFDDHSTLMELKGDSFTDKWNQIINAKTAWGSTNFQSVIDLIVKTRTEHPEIPLEEFPTTLLVVSDMQFNPCGNSTNTDVMLNKLRTVFPDEWVDNFKAIWWYCAGRDGASNDVPSTMEHGGQYLFSGFDGSIVSLILNKTVDAKTGKVRNLTMEEAVDVALNQEVLQLVN